MIKSGLTKVGSVGGSSAPAAKTSAPAKKEEPKKEVKKEEPKVEEEEEFGGADLFGGDFWSFLFKHHHISQFLFTLFFMIWKRIHLLIVYIMLVGIDLKINFLIES